MASGIGSQRLEDIRKSDAGMEGRAMTGDGRPTIETSIMLLDEELGHTIELVSGLFHRLDTVLRREREEVAMKDSQDPSDVPPWSRVQEEVRSRVGMIERLNAQLRDLHERIDL